MMSGVAVSRYILANYTPLTEVVSPTRIMAGTIPAPPTGTAPTPAVGIVEVSGNQRNTLGMTEPNVLHTERVQVGIQASSYPQQKQILGLIRKAMGNRYGVVNGTF